jgi:ectoine hydroxylase-related dioxygenase (phytanoyl-CoA dioxygenase family)
VSAAQILLREDVYLWHSKVMLKAAGAGSWEWHQDYGYWYREGCLRPAMLACMLVLDRATQQNGCLKVLVGSHRCGRMDHGIVGDQATAEHERLKALEDRLPVEYLEAEPGAAILFHCNTLHTSEPNLSTRPRRALICAYNAESNRPYDR